MAKKTFTPEQRDEMLRLRGDGMSWNKIGRHFGCDDDVVHRVCDPAWRRRRNDRAVERRAYCCILRHPVRHAECAPICDPRRDDVPRPVTIGQMLLGDPLPGRSALDRRTMGAE